MAVLAAACGGEPDTPSAAGSDAASRAGGATASGAAPADRPAVPAAGRYQAVASVESPATVSGVVTVAGPVPRLRPREVTTDKDACGEDHKPNPSLVLGPGNLLADAVVRLEGVARGKAFEPVAPLLDQKKCLFVPYVQVVPAGSELALLNSDPVLHNVHAYDAANATLFNIGTPLQGVRVPQKVSARGLVRIKCDVHPWMTGFLYASEHPYATVTGKDGRFSLGGVPPGSYTLSVWHEVLGTKETRVTVEPGGAVSVDVALSVGG